MPDSLMVKMFSFHWTRAQPNCQSNVHAYNEHYVRKHTKVNAHNHHNNPNLIQLSSFFFDQLIKRMRRRKSWQQTNNEMRTLKWNEMTMMKKTAQIELDGPHLANEFLRLHMWHEWIEQQPKKTQILWTSSFQINRNEMNKKIMRWHASTHNWMRWYAQKTV